MHPVITALPYLPLGREFDIGPWRAQPLGAYEGSWLSDDFERLCRVFLGAFRRPSGEPLSNPALVTRVGSGADGVPPSGAEHRALVLAIGFAVLDANPDWEPEGHGWSCATADNAQLWIQPIDIIDARFTLESGLRVRTLAGGLRLNEELTVPVPVETHFPFAVMPDSEQATILYELALGEDGTDAEVSRLLVGVDWLIASWRNTPSLSWESRLVQMKTAFEALLDESDTARALPLLRLLFEEAEPHQTEALWRPNETTLVRVVRERQFDVTLIEHWYGALSDARNAIIHEGRRGAEVLVYDEESPYEGPFVDVGDRVLREAIKAKLATIGYPRAAMTPLHRAVHDQLARDETAES
jgi:hypothetical protein